MFDAVKRIFWLWGESFKSMGRVSTFVPFIIYAFIQFGILVSLVNFINPPFAGFYVAMIKKLFNEAALHYPAFYYIISPMFNQINMIISGFIGIIIISLATQLFARQYRNRDSEIGTAIGVSFQKYGALLVVWIIETALTLLIIIGLPLLLNKIFVPSYTVSRVFELIGLLTGIVVSSMFAYTTALIVLDNQSIGGGISKTLAIFGKHSFISYVIVAVPTLAYFPLSFVLRKVDLIITKFSPEMITTLLAVGIVLTIFTSYVQIGSITRFYLSITERKR
jgi:hypothetical protein